MELFEPDVGLRRTGAGHSDPARSISLGQLKAQYALPAKDTK
jgi:hypothetical protein